MDDLAVAIEAAEDGATVGRLSRRLGVVQEILREEHRVVTGDPLIDFWEKEIAAGRTPDLDMAVEDIPK